MGLRSPRPSMVAMIFPPVVLRGTRCRKRHRRRRRHTKRKSIDGLSSFALRGVRKRCSGPSPSTGDATHISSLYAPRRQTAAVHMEAPRNLAQALFAQDVHQAQLWHCMHHHKHIRHSCRHQHRCLRILPDRSHNQPRCRLVRRLHLMGESQLTTARAPRWRRTQRSLPASAQRRARSHTQRQSATAVHFQGEAMAPITSDVVTSHPARSRQRLLRRQHARRSHLLHHGVTRPRQQDATTRWWDLLGLRRVAFEILPSRVQGMMCQIVQNPRPGIEAHALPPPSQHRCARRSHQLHRGATRPRRQGAKAHGQDLLSIQ
mmetsp:Transcript_3946/g.9591  ORF Transcript_3946/g.9591 Transcript_3946/m.9591 type:complete len:318 (-) Transcript_3946:634-1587(-)